MKKPEYDVLIIGAGVSGLTSAALLSKHGLRVCVLEQHYEVGGYLQGFERKNFTFDTAIHWLNQYGKNGSVSAVFNYIGGDYPRPLQMETIQKHITPFHTYTLTNHPDELKKKLIRDFPHEKKGIEHFFSKAKKIAEVSNRFPGFFQSPETMSFTQKNLFLFKRFFSIIPLIPYALYSGEKGVSKGLSKYFFNDKKLQELFCAEQDLLSCLFPVAWAYNNDYQNPPIGGSRVITDWLHQKALDQGTEVILSANVTAVNAENGVFQSLTYNKRGKQHTLTSRYLIAACDAEVLYKKLFPKNLVNTKLLDKMDQAELYSSSVTISIALDCPAEALGFGKELILLCKDNPLRMDHSSGDPEKSAISILAPSVRDKTLSPDGKGTLTLYVPAWMSYENNWNTTPGKNGDPERTEAYKILKEKFANKILERVEQEVCPELRKHILFYEIATPVTYYRYTYNKNGTMMGGRPGKKNMQAKVAHYKTPLENAFIGGQWAELGGGVPIAVKAAYNASLLVLKNSNHVAFNELKNAYHQFFNDSKTQ